MTPHHTASSERVIAEAYARFPGDDLGSTRYGFIEGAKFAAARAPSPSSADVETLAELAISNGECAAQVEIKDSELRDSLLRNVIATFGPRLAVSANDATEMLRARSLVENHIQVYGMVPNPDKLKEAIARSLRESAATPAMPAPADAEPVAWPDGWKLVPLKSNRTMTMAACDRLPSCDHVFGHAGQLCANVWEQMVAAAPLPPLYARPASPVMAEVEKAQETIINRIAGLRSHQIDLEERDALLTDVSAALTKLRAERDDATPRPERSTESSAPENSGAA